VRDALVAVGVPREKIVVLADGLPAEAFVVRETKQGPPFRLAHVGAFDGRKGQEIVVGVVSRLAADGIDVQAHFLGDGPARAAVESLAARRGVRERCTFAGMVTDVPERLAASHVLLLPSESEGAALALVEAMAAGCAVVAHDVGGTAEMLADGSAGRLVTDLLEEHWTQAVRELLEAPERRAALIAAGRRMAAERTLDRTVLAIERELAVAVAGKAP
jgi:glycosyltransferase involved in cell wall biosynthesis